MILLRMPCKIYVKHHGVCHLHLTVSHTSHVLHACYMTCHLSQWFSHTNDKVGHICQISYSKTAIIQSIAHFLTKEHRTGFSDKNMETTNLPRTAITTYQTSVTIHKIPLLFLITVNTLNIRMCYCLDLSQPYNRSFHKAFHIITNCTKVSPNQHKILYTLYPYHKYL